MTSSLDSDKPGVPSPIAGKKDYKQRQEDHDLKPTKGRGWFKFQLLFGVVGLFAAFLLARKPAAPLPEAYALCSKENDKIYLVDDKNTQTQCIVVEGAYIVGTGSLDTVRGNWSKLRPSQVALEVRFIKPGAIIIPGITDSHAHILEYGATQQLPLEGSKTIQGIHFARRLRRLSLSSSTDAVARVREYILSTPEIYNDTTKLITGGGWDHTVWPSSTWPTAADLEADSVIRGRHVVLQSKDCHALWVSSKALEISAPFPDSVEGGVIVRDGNGAPTGTLLDNAQDLLKQPELTESDLLRRFKVAVRDAHKYGLTSIHDAGLNPKSLAFFKRQAETGPLPIRVYGMSFFDENEPYWGNTSRPIIGGESDRLSARSVKIFADGALRTGGAALYEPYADNPTTNGFMRLDPEILFKFIPMFLRDEWQVNVHAIGDRANGIVLDAFEASLKGANVKALRPRLEHAQMMTKADMARLGKLGVIASIQPAHAISDMWYAEDRLGPDRIKSLYAFRSVVDSGAKITLGSDFPVESMNPLAGFYAAVTRQSLDGRSPHGPDGWFPEQCLTRQEALRGRNDNRPCIGKRADFTILSQDLMSVPFADILATEVHATVIDGRPVYGNI
ncbi:hypothetical protein NLJ89_g62 [Agrocybe chaxingu]|uniref:Amidohydrolase 3 domain-containing protein n=1 Tax=Agrocybe chaxingu TaxID=84603 RepID=A0A9W8N2P3_9AGAR|nr:hypothetical protein NLJ89_g62 [Agrocybe chaxingu]